MSVSKRHYRVIAAMGLIGILVLATMSAGAYTGSKLVVGSSHTTNTDFHNARTLNNLTVANYNVTLESATGFSVLDDFNDGDISEYSGDTGSASATTQHVYEGSHALKISSSGDDVAVSRTDVTVRQGDHLSVRVYEGTGGNFEKAFFGVQSASGWDSISGYFVEIDDNSGFKLTRMDSGSRTNLASKSITAPENEWLEFEIEWGNNGQIDVTLKDSNGNILKTLSATDTTYSSGGIGFSIFDTTAYFDYYIGTGDGNPDEATYVSQPHTVENSEQATVDMPVLENATAHVTVNSSAGAVLAQNSYTTPGNKTLAWSPNSATSTHVNVTVVNESGNGKPSFTLADEAIWFDNEAPTVNNASASPSGDLQSSTPPFEIDVNDNTFPLAQGDTATAELYVDGTLKGSDTLTSNGTASVTATVSEGGEHTYNWSVNDSYGGEAVSDTFTVSTPANITFRNASNASQIISGIEIQVKFYSTDVNTVIQKTDSDKDGKISLTGLPTTDAFVVTVMSDGYHDRRVYISSIYEQNDVYLLNSTAYPLSNDAAIQTNFVFEDRTGKFPADSTVLRVKRAVDKNNDGNFTLENTAGDFFGAAGEFPFIGQYQTRYRITVENQQGTVRSLGPFIPTETGVKTLTIGDIQFPEENGTGRYFEADLEVNQSRILVAYNDDTDNTTDINLTVFERGNESNIIQAQNYSGPFGRLEAVVDLTESQTEKEWVVEYRASRDNQAIAGRRLVGGSSLNFPLDPLWLGTLSFGFITIVGSLYGPRTSQIGGVAMVITAAMLMYFQLVYIAVPMLFVAGIVAVGGVIYDQGRP